MNHMFRLDVFVLPKFYMCEKTRDLLYSGSRSKQGKSLLAKQACVSQECPNELKAKIGFYGPQDCTDNERIDEAGMQL